MIRAILIDDEKPALRQLERLLLSDGRIQIEAQYTSAAEGLAHLENARVEAVFLDIDMPGMKGLETAEHIQELAPDTRVVYVTAYSEYALDAFEQYALDYILKPVIPERLKKTIDRLQSLYRQPESASTAANAPSAPAPRYRIQLFKRLALVDENGIGDKLKWRTAKARELLAYLLHHNGEWVSKDAILEHVLNEHSGEKAATQLHTAVYLIRRLLKDWGADVRIAYARDSYRMICGTVETDIGRFGRLMRELRTLEGENRAAAAEALTLYRGDYLEDHDYAWAEPYRVELRNRHTRLTMQVARAEIADGRGADALAKLNPLQDKEPYLEEIVRLRMDAYGQLKNYAAIRELYGHYCSLLLTELHIEPEEETARCYEAWIRNR